MALEGKMAAAIDSSIAAAILLQRKRQVLEDEASLKFRVAVPGFEGQDVGVGADIVRAA